MEIKEHLRKISSIAQLPFPTITWVRNNYLLLNNYITELKAMLDTMRELPESINSFSQDLAGQLSFMCQRYEYLIDDLQDKCKNIEAVVRTVDCVKEGENQRLLKELQDKNQVIQILTKKLTKLQVMVNCDNSSARARVRPSEQSAPIEIPRLHTSPTPDPKYSTSHGANIQEIKNRNIALRDRYFNYKRQNDLLKNKLNKMSKTQFRAPQTSTICYTDRDYKEPSKGIYHRRLLQRIETEKEKIQESLLARLNRNPAIDQKENIQTNRREGKEEVSQALSTFLHTLRSC